MWNTDLPGAAERAPSWAVESSATHADQRSMLHAFDQSLRAITYADLYDASPRVRVAIAEELATEPVYRLVRFVWEPLV